MFMQLNRDHVHVSPSGISIAFHKDKPTHVPNKMVKEIISLGGTASEENSSEMVSVAAEEMRAQETAAKARTATIEDAIKTMLERNQRGDFTAGNRPNLRILGNMAGLEVTPEELDPIWNRIKEEMA